MESSREELLYGWYKRCISPVEAELIRRCYEVLRCNGNFDTLFNIYNKTPQTPIVLRKITMFPRLKELQSEVDKIPREMYGERFSLHTLVLEFEPRRRMEEEIWPGAQEAIGELNLILEDSLAIKEVFE